MLVVLITGLPGTGKSTMAEVAGRALAAPVLGHDWAMSGLRPFPRCRTRSTAWAPAGTAASGGPLLWALARSQLRLGSSVVLDGVARGPEVEGTRLVAAEEGAGVLVVMTTRAATPGSTARGSRAAAPIPNWYELDWDHVAAGAGGVGCLPTGLDLVLEARDPWRRTPSGCAAASRS